MKARAKLHGRGYGGRVAAVVKKAFPVNCQLLCVVTVAAMSDKQINLEDRNDKLATHMPLCQAGKKWYPKKKEKRRKSRSIGEPQFEEAPERLE